MKKNYPWWIKERNNGQAPTYFVACGQMSKTAARRNENPLVGHNTMHEFADEASYNAKLESLRSQKGVSVL